MSAKTTIITVCYNSTDVLPTMLDCLPNGALVVLVDNASSDIAALRILAQKYGAQLIENTVNVGFGAGNNQGAKLAQTPYLMFLNPDAQLAPDCLSVLEAAATTYPNASAFNPRLLDRHGGEIFRRKTRLDRSFELTGPAPAEDAEIPTLLGAAIFTPRAIFDELGGFDPDIFLYHEDDDLSLRARQLGPLMRIPGALVTHSEGRSTARTPQVAAFKAYHMARSKVYTYTKHGHRMAWLRTVCEGVLSLLSPLMFSARKRAKALGFLKGAISARRDGGRGFG
ncbi:MAG: glycosyltransferase family 2 protein [Sulfitobacter sp.]